MIEARALILDIQQTRQRLEELGAVFDSDYGFKDIIFVPKKEAYNLSDDFLRARVYTNNNWETKPVVLIRKQTEFKEVGKIDHILLRQEFDTEQEAVDYVMTNLRDMFAYGFEYERNGWEYQFEGRQIFIEDIKGYKPSIEIEADSEQEIESLFSRIGILEKVSVSIPEVMEMIFGSSF